MEGDLEGMREELSNLWGKVNSSLHHRVTSDSSARFGSRRLALRLMTNEAVAQSINSDNDCSSPVFPSTDRIPPLPVLTDGRSGPGECEGEPVSQKYSLSGAKGLGSLRKGDLKIEGDFGVESGKGIIGSEENGLHSKRIAAEEIVLVHKLVAKLEEAKVLRWKGKMKDDLLIAMEREKEGLLIEAKQAAEKVKELQQRLVQLEGGSGTGKDGGKEAGRETGGEVGKDAGREQGRDREIRGSPAKEKESRVNEMKDGEGKRGGTTLSPRPPPPRFPGVAWEREKAAAEACSEKLKKELLIAQRSLHEMMAKNEALAEEVEDQSVRLAECERNLKVVEQERDELTGEIRLAMEGWERAVQDASMLAMHAEDLGQEMQSMEGELATLKKALQRAEEDLEKLREQQAKQNQEREAQQGVEIMRLQTLGRKWKSLIEEATCSAALVAPPKTSSADVSEKRMVKATKAGGDGSAAYPALKGALFFADANSSSSENGGPHVTANAKPWVPLGGAGGHREWDRNDGAVEYESSSNYDNALPNAVPRAVSRSSLASYRLNVSLEPSRASPSHRRSVERPTFRVEDEFEGSESPDRPKPNSHQWRRRAESMNLGNRSPSRYDNDNSSSQPFAPSLDDGAPVPSSQYSTLHHSGSSGGYDINIERSLGPSKLKKSHSSSNLHDNDDDLTKLAGPSAPDSHWQPQFTSSASSDTKWLPQSTSFLSAPFPPQGSSQGSLRPTQPHEVSSRPSQGDRRTMPRSAPLARRSNFSNPRPMNHQQHEQQQQGQGVGSSSLLYPS
eukprot:TRINITY_DN36205_c0_g1_i1.p1 TRINITY_DN36205_c0_g1~~TRINITY_DN36205_c0_g1_i1.p1  ORF type:complete len:788 (-),score=166.23 TRINITY_DN36205_c0_g1_i1:1819-4182(-)